LRGLLGAYIASSNGWGTVWGLPSAITDAAGPLGLNEVEM
jgi:hypothetical protein